MQIKHFTSPQKLSNFLIFKTGKLALAGQNTQRQSKPILVLVSLKPLTCRRFRQNDFSHEIEWAVFTIS